MGPSRKSPLAESCPLVILLRTSTTCTVCGPSRQLLEAPSGLTHSPFPYYYILDHIVYSSALLFFLFFPILKTVALFSPLFPPSGIHHLYRLLCNQSLPGPLLANGWVATSWEEIPLKARRFKATSKYLWVSAVFWNVCISLRFPFFGSWPTEALRISVTCRLQVQAVLRPPVMRQQGEVFSPSVLICCWEAAHLGHGQSWQSQFRVSSSSSLKIPLRFSFSNLWCEL